MQLEQAKQRVRDLYTTRKPWLVAACATMVVVVAATVIIFQSAHSGDVRGTASAAQRPRVIPLSVLSVTPASGAKDVSFNAPITIQFSTPLASNWTPPVLSPAVPGTWTEPTPSTLSFEPAGNYVPDSTINVGIPTGNATLLATNGTTLDAPFMTSFTVQGATMLRLQELLAELNYLPVAFVPPGTSPATVPSTSTTPPSATTPSSSPVTTPQSSTTSTIVSSTTSPPTSSTTSTTIATAPLATSTVALDAEPDVASAISLTSLPGSFTWRFSNTPSQLLALFQPGTYNVVTQGAIMAFQSEHNLGIDGEIGYSLWSALLDAVANRDVTTRPYNYLIATETLPESLYVWSNGAVVYESLANTGVEGASTPLGTWPVYLRFTSTTMSGTNPDGKPYKDPGVPWVSYFIGNDAVHGFIRESYGFPQSDGCVELPVANAAVVFPMDPYGTLVTVTTGDLASELDVQPPMSGD